MEWNKGMEARLSEFCDEAFVLDTIEKKKVIVEDSSPEQAQSYHRSEIETEELEEILRESRKKKNNEKSAAQGYVLLGCIFPILREKEADLRSTEGHYVSFETIPEVNLGSDDHLSQGHTDQSSVNKPVESMLSLVEENMMVLRVETQSQTEALSIVPIQVCLPLSQSTTVLEIEPTLVSEIEPTPAKSPSEKVNEETTKRSRIILGTPEPPPKTEQSTPTLPPAPFKVNSAPEDAVAPMMIARTASYIPKQGPMPSFSLDLTDSSQEEATTQESAAMQEGDRGRKLLKRQN
ncbi:hypothetical protein Ahy_B10g102779 [Arachis hypogaea]|uniref:Uncharacterized protein n=1 Tax=Arachis hypogaea TaxID=3818 RepID=A0A444X2H0_ARAHY|nr:hypothetical protein Ahy_B10g102779 [Arachis hypogaea]